MLTSLLSIFGATQCSDTTTTFLGFVPWYHYLTLVNNHGRCEVDPNSFTLLGAHSSILLVLLAILDDVFMAAGLLAVVFVIYAGAKFILSQGAPDEAAKARTTVFNALIGLAIAAVAIGVVSFIGTQVTNVRAGQGKYLNLNPLPDLTAQAQGSTLIQTGLSITFGILGAISFLVIVLAGLQYILSQGDSAAVKKAKDAIIYALIGLVLAIVAQSIVSFAVNFRP